MQAIHVLHNSAENKPILLNQQKDRKADRSKVEIFCVYHQFCWYNTNVPRTNTIHTRAVCKKNVRKLFLLLSFSLTLSLTHTHTRTDGHMKKFFSILSQRAATYRPSKQPTFNCQQEIILLDIPSFIVISTSDRWRRSNGARTKLIFAY